MNARQLKHTYREKIEKFFYRVKVHPWYERVMLLPISVRAVLSFFLFLFGLVGLFTPVPAGWMLIGIAAVILFGIHEVKRHSIRLFFRLRLHHVGELLRYTFKQ